MPPHWTSFISVADADSTAARARELGGTLLREPFDLMDAGRVAVVQDPLGAIVSWQPRRRSGAELVDDIGAMCWNELVTADLERAKAFYRDLLGWKYDTDDAGYTTIRNGERLNGGMREGSPASWLPHFMVESADGALREAEQAGARTLMPPADMQFGALRGDRGPARRRLRHVRERLGRLVEVRR